MRIHYLQHVPFEGLGFIEPWIREQGHLLTSTPLFAADRLPQTAAFDMLIILGGPMGVHDTPVHAWLSPEKRLIEKSLREEKKVLGICLGAQLMADVLGARVYPNAEKEIGWHRVSRVATASRTALDGVLPDAFFAFHWHGDTFDLPAGARHLAGSDACRRQAFYYPPRALGLQFHLESTRQSIDALIEHCGADLIPAPFVQSRTDIRSRSDLIGPSNDIMRGILMFLQHA